MSEKVFIPLGLLLMLGCALALNFYGWKDAPNSVARSTSRPTPAVVRLATSEPASTQTATPPATGPHVLDPTLVSAIFEAVQKGDAVKTRRTLEADPLLIDARDTNGATPLHHITNGEVARVLLDHGATLDARDAHGATPLRWLLVEPSTTRLAIAAVLIKKGAKVDDVFLAVASNDATSLKAMLKKDASVVKSKTAAGDVFGENILPLRMAVEYGRGTVAKMLLDAGADVNAISGRDGGGTALHAAVWDDQTDIAKLLMDRGANLELPDPAHNRTPLGWAVVAGRKTMVEGLLKRGANVSDQVLQDAQAAARGELKDAPNVSAETRMAIVQILEERLKPATVPTSLPATTPSTAPGDVPAVTPTSSPSTAPTSAPTPPANVDG